MGGRGAKGRLASLVARYLRNERNRRASELQVGDAAADRKRSFAVTFSHGSRKRVLNGRQGIRPELVRRSGGG